MRFSVAQNTSFLTAASIIQKIISFIYFTFIARFIGVENTGEYFFALTFTTIFTVIADFGLGPVFTREAAKHPENSPKYLSTVLWGKILFGLGAYGLIIFFVNILKYADSIKMLVYLSGITVFFDNLQGAFFSMFRAQKNLFYESIGVIGAQFTTLLIGTVALVLRWPMYSLVIAYTIPSSLNAVFAGAIAYTKYGWRPNTTPDLGIFKLFLHIAWPFALASFLGRLYAYADSVLISKILNSHELGWWSVPNKITTAFQFIPAALSASIYPAMSNLSTAGYEKIGELFEKSWRYLFTVLFPIAFGIAALAKPIIIHLYTAAYQSSITVLQVLLLGMIFAFLNLINGATLNATGRQKWQTFLLGGMLALNLILNLIFIPRFGIIAAATIELGTNALLCLLGLGVLRRYIPLRLKIIVHLLGQTIWPAIVMAITVAWLSQYIHFLLTIPIGALVYISLLFATKGIDRQLIAEAKIKIWKSNQG